MTFLRLAAWIFLCACLLSGCESLRLHDVQRNEQGAAAREAWAKVDLNALIATERANLNELLAAELETQDELATGIRDHHLRSLVEARTVNDGLLRPVRDRLTDVVGAPDEFRSALDREESLRTSARGLRMTRDAFEDFFKQEPPPCSALAHGARPPAMVRALAKLEGAANGAAATILDELTEECDLSAGNDRTAVYSALSGRVMKEALARYEGDVEALVKAKNASAAAQAKYEEAREAYERALDAAQSDSSARDEVVKIAADLKDALADLTSTGDAFSIRFLAEERLQAIDAFLEAVTEGKPGETPAGASDATAAFIIVPDLLDNARQSLADARKPLAMPLLIRRNYEQLSLEAAKRDIAARELMVQLSGELLDALFDQGRQLWMADRALNEKRVVGLHDTPVLEAFGAKCRNGQGGDACRDAKELLYSGAARYLDAIHRLDARRYKLEYRRIAAMHERSLAYAEVNARQWQSLIGVAVQQVSDSASGGIKAEQVIALLNAAGVVWIGAGVN